eukprot:TRINITY_DN3747_c0_g1_i1.p1 TRINITY_DN3747_c0_g1~~TRINITY_DN3747_c0_g1_i1.p1  ORF type:complete len:634 (-),score=150.58 TRINITY_DN3747_c0_g1_i1:205-2019(-)
MSEHEGRRRKHRSRSRRHGHHHRRRHHHGDSAKGEADAAARGAAPPPGAPDPAAWYGGPPPADWRVVRGGPPAGWHGTAGQPPPVAPPGGYMPPGGAPPPRPLGGPPPPQGYAPPPHAPPPEMRYEAAYGSGEGQDPHAQPFSAVPPPAGLDDGPSRWKGKGGGGGLPDGLVASGLAPELCTLTVLNRHFRQFGEVLRIAVQAEEGRAFIQFSDRNSAEAALGAPVLDRPEIQLSRAPRSDKGKGKAGKAKGKDGKTVENRVLHASPEEQRKIDQAKQKREEITNRKAQLLSAYTNQLKAVMAKLQDATLTEAKRDAMKAILNTIKEKMDSLNAPAGGEDAGTGGARRLEQAATPTKNRGKGGKDSSASKPYGKGSNSLDLRPKVLRVAITQEWTEERLREELLKFDVGPERVLDILWQVGGDGQPSTEYSLIRFRDRRSAERLFARKAELPFSSLDWCDCSTLPPPQSPAMTPRRETPGGGDVTTLSELLPPTAEAKASAGDDEVDEANLQKNLAAALNAAEDETAAPAESSEGAAASADDAATSAAAAAEASAPASGEAAPGADAAAAAAPEAPAAAAEEAAPEAEASWGGDEEDEAAAAGT